MQICPAMGSYIYFLSFPLASFSPSPNHHPPPTLGYSVSQEGRGCALRDPRVLGSVGFVRVFGLRRGGWVGVVLYLIARYTLASSSSIVL